MLIVISRCLSLSWRVICMSTPLFMPPHPFLCNNNSLKAFRPLLVAALEALVQSNVSMHALPHDPSFIILTLATFLKWRKMLQSALPLVSEKYVRMSACVLRASWTARGRYKRGACVCPLLCIVVRLCICISMIKEHRNTALAIYC